MSRLALVASMAGLAGAIFRQAGLAPSQQEPTNLMDSVGQQIATLDEELQRKAREHSAHVKAMLQAFEARLEEKQRNNELIKEWNDAFQAKVSQQETVNDLRRAELNRTRYAVAQEANQLRAIALNISRAGDVIEDVVAVGETRIAMKSRRDSALASMLQVDGPNHEDLVDLRNSLSDIHSEMEANMTQTFRRSYDTLLEKEHELLLEQKNLTTTLARLGDEGQALAVEIDRLNLILNETSEKVAHLEMIGKKIVLSANQQREKSMRDMDLAPSVNKSNQEQMNVSSSEANNNISMQFDATSRLYETPPQRHESRGLIGRMLDNVFGAKESPIKPADAAPKAEHNESRNGSFALMEALL